MASCRTIGGLRPILYLSVKEAGDRGIGNNLIGALAEAMALVFETQVFYRNAASTNRGNDLLGLPDGHARIVSSVDHKKRCGNSVYMMDGRDAFQEFSIILQTPILRLA